MLPNMLLPHKTYDTLLYRLQHHTQTSHTPRSLSLISSCVASAFGITLQKAFSLCLQYEILKICDGNVFKENHELTSLFLLGTIV